MNININDALRNALDTIGQDNPEPELDALGRQIAVVLANREAAAASEPTTYAKKIILVDGRPLPEPEVTGSSAT